MKTEFTHKIVRGLLIALAVCLVAAGGSRLYRSMNRRWALEAQAEAIIRQNITTAKGQTTTWADRLDGQTTKAGVYERYEGKSEADLPEQDPWGTPLKVMYSKGGVMEVLKVISLGPDRRQGTHDDIVDQRQSTNFSGIGSGIKDGLTPGFLKKKEKDAVPTR